MQSVHTFIFASTGHNRCEMLCLPIWPSSARRWQSTVILSAPCWMMTRCLGWNGINATQYQSKKVWLVEWSLHNKNNRSMMSILFSGFPTKKIYVICSAVLWSKTLLNNNSVPENIFSSMFQIILTLDIHYVFYPGDGYNIILDLEFELTFQTTQKWQGEKRSVTTKVDEIPDGATAVDAAVANYRKSKPKMWWRCFGGCKCDVTWNMRCEHRVRMIHVCYSLVM